MRTVVEAPVAQSARSTPTTRPDWKALTLAAVGLLVTFAAPPHRPDLLVTGLVASAIGILWSPQAGPVLIGALLPAFFFSRSLVGPVSMSPPGLALALTWLSIALRHRTLGLRWPTSAYDWPVALLLLASLLSLAVTQYPLLSVRELRALIFEPLLFFLLLQAS